MAKESGINCVFQISEDDSPETFVSVAGQRDTQLQLSAADVDVADKTTGGWGSRLAGIRDATVTLSGVANWPDTTGLELLRQRFDQAGTVGTTIRGKAQLNAAGAGYVGDWYITQLQYSGGHAGATEYSITLQNASALDYTAS